jgi:hypothetical protein
LRQCLRDFVGAFFADIYADMLTSWHRSSANHVVNLLGSGKASALNWKHLSAAFYSILIGKSLSLLHGIGEISILLGLLRVLFGFCEQNLN